MTTETLLLSPEGLRELAYIEVVKQQQEASRALEFADLVRQAEKAALKASTGPTIGEK